jgi:hypothetical protein
VAAEMSLSPGRYRGHSRRRLETNKGDDAGHAEPYDGTGCRLQLGGVDVAPMSRIDEPRQVPHVLGRDRCLYLECLSRQDGITVERVRMSGRRARAARLPRAGQRGA